MTGWWKNMQRHVRSSNQADKHQRQNSLAPNGPIPYGGNIEIGSNFSEYAECFLATEWSPKVVFVPTSTRLIVLLRCSGVGGWDASGPSKVLCRESGAQRFLFSITKEHLFGGHTKKRSSWSSWEKICREKSHENFSGKVRRDSSKNPSHPQKFACTYTALLVCFLSPSPLYTAALRFELRDVLSMMRTRL